MPDIVCLQELKCEDKRFPIKAIRDAGYQAIWKEEKSWNGITILSRTEIKGLRRDLPGEDPEYVAYLLGVDNVPYLSIFAR